MTSDTHTEERTCPTCQGTFTVQVPAPGRPRTYCTTRCRNRAGNAKRLAYWREIGDLAQQDPRGQLQPCGWCGTHSPGADYCSLACDVLHTELKRLRLQLQGLRRTMPVPGLREKFDKLDRMTYTRKTLRAENRERYYGPARQQVDKRRAKRQAEEEREALRAAARRRLVQQVQQRDERVARRRAKKGN